MDTVNLEPRISTVKSIEGLNRPWKDRYEATALYEAACKVFEIPSMGEVVAHAPSAEVLAAVVQGDRVSGWGWSPHPEGEECHCYPGCGVVVEYSRVRVGSYANLPEYVEAVFTTVTSERKITLVFSVIGTEERFCSVRIEFGASGSIGAASQVLAWCAGDSRLPQAGWLAWANPGFRIEFAHNGPGNWGKRSSSEEDGRVRRLLLEQLPITKNWYEDVILGQNPEVAEKARLCSEAHHRLVQPGGVEGGLQQP